MIILHRVCASRQELLSQARAGCHFKYSLKILHCHRDAEPKGMSRLLVQVFYYLFLTKLLRTADLKKGAINLIVHSFIKDILTKKLLNV